VGGRSEGDPHRDLDYESLRKESAFFSKKTHCDYSEQWGKDERGRKADRLV
jgi:hypothetical protein